MTPTVARLLVATACVVAAATAAQAQGRMRQADPSGAPGERPPVPSIPRVPADPARPFVGVWEGEFKPNDPGAEGIPYVVVIEYLNGGYTGYTMVGPRRGLSRHVADSATASTLHWEQPNSGGGFLVFTAKRSGSNGLAATMSMRDAPGPAGAGDVRASVQLRRHEGSR